MELLNSVLSYRIEVASKQLPNFSDYIILPNEGLIWSKKSNRFIGSKNSDGYYKTNLTDNNGRQTHRYLHRFIWEGVYGSIPDGIEVNHIDENKTNNSIFNLNLMTHKENNNWGTRTERAAKTQSKPVGGYINGELKITFPSTKEAGRNGFKHSAVCRCCQGKQKTHKGYNWRYLEN